MLSKTFKCGMSRVLLGVFRVVEPTICQWLAKFVYFDVAHGIATTKRNMTLTSFDVVSTLLFYL